MADQKEPEEAKKAEGEEHPAHEARGRHRGKETEERLAQLNARVAELEQSLQAREEELEKQRKETQEYLEGWQRERAGFENFRKRTTRELDDAGIVGKIDLIRAILPAVDNLARAIEDTSGDAEVVRKGVRMTYEQLVAVLERQGLKEVPSTGEQFDPNVHEAIDAVPDTGQPPETIVQDVQKGYLFGDRLVRPARVRVAR